MRDGGKRDIFGLVGLVDPDSVTLAEGTTTRILPRQAHAITVPDEAAEGQRLCIGLCVQQRGQFRSLLQPAGWQVESNGAQLVMSRARPGGRS